MRVEHLPSHLALLTLQQFCLLLALLFVHGSCTAATEDAVSVSGEAQVQLVRRGLHTREYRGRGTTERRAQNQRATKERAEERSLSLTFPPSFGRQCISCLYDGHLSSLLSLPVPYLPLLLKETIHNDDKGLLLEFACRVTCCPLSLLHITSTSLNDYELLSAWPLLEAALQIGRYVTETRKRDGSP